jgi:hypothetical protein
MFAANKTIDQTAWTVSDSSAVRRLVAIGLGAVTLVGVCTSPSPLVVLTSGIVSILILISVWRPSELPILLVPIYVQFSQVALKPITTAITNKPLQDLADFNANLEPAALLGLAGVAALVSGLRIGAGNARARGEDVAIEEWPFRAILPLVFGVIVIGHVLGLVAERFDSARQILLALSGIRWAGLFVMAYLALRTKQGLGWLAVVAGFELVVGMSGFFGEFRLVLVVLAAAAVAALQRVHLGSVLAILASAVLAVGLAVFWSVVKIPYREFLNQGTGAQVALQPLDERLSFLAGEAANFGNLQYEIGVELLLQRMSYIDFLAATMERVPEELPHEDGALLGATLWHVLTPRILFPDKPELPSDTLVTAHYTGLENAILADTNTSISIGYMGELYIDFGVAGALLVVFLMGLSYGRCYRSIRDYSCTPMFINYGLCMMVALPLSSFETSLIKDVGTVAMVVASALALQRVIWPVLLSLRLMRGSSRPSFGDRMQA